MPARGRREVRDVQPELAHRRVLEAIPEAIVVAHSTTGTIVYANPAVADLLGWEPYELEGMNVDQLVPSRLREAHTAGFHRFATTGERALMGRTVRLPARCKDGVTEVEVELTLAEARGAGLVVATLRDVSQRVELERQLAFVSQLQDTTALATRLGSTTDIDEIATIVAATLVKSFEAAGAEVWIATPDDTALILSGTAGISRALGTRLEMDSPSLITQATRSRLPVILNFVPDDGVEETREARAYGFDAQVVYPMIAADHVRGAVRATFRERLSLDQTELLATMAAVVASSVEIALTVQREQDARRDAEEGQARLAFLSEASAMLAGSLDETTTLDNLCRLATRTIADWTTVHLAMPDGAPPHEAALAHRTPEGEETVRRIGEQYVYSAKIPFGPPHVIATGEPELNAHITGEMLRVAAYDDTHYALLTSLDMCSGLCVPLVAGGEVLGAMSFVRNNPRPHYTQDDLELACELGRRAALAIENARLHAAVELSRNRMRSVIEGVSAVLWEADPQTFDFTFVNRQAETMFGHPAERWSERGFLESILHPDDIQVMLESYRTARRTGDDFEIEIRIHASDGTWRWTRNHVFIEVSTDGVVALRGLMTDITAAREAQAAADLSMAMLEAQSQASIDGVVVIAADGTIAWANRRFREMSGLDDDDMTRPFAEVIETLAGQSVHPASFMQRATWLMEHPEEPGRDEVVLRDGRIIDRYVSPLVTERKLAQGQAWYFRDVTNERRAQREIFESRERFATLARSLQRSLLPPVSPTVPGLEIGTVYQAFGDAAEVGGDFYDLFQAGPDAWAIVIGDVCGRGPEAASITALTRYSVRAAGLGQTAPEAVLRTLNEAILRDEPGDIYCTAIYALVRSGSPGVAVELTCAGHPPPLVLRASGIVSKVGSHGTLLGVLPEPDMSTELVLLDPGDSLLLYTDGALEARAERDQFGEDRLIDVLASCRGQSAQEIVDAVEAAVMGFAGGEMADGLALLSITVPARST